MTFSPDFALALANLRRAHADLLAVATREACEAPADSGYPAGRLEVRLAGGRLLVVAEEMIVPEDAEIDSMALTFRESSALAECRRAVNEMSAQ